MKNEKSTKYITVKDDSIIKKNGSTHQTEREEQKERMFTIA